MKSNAVVVAPPEGRGRGACVAGAVVAGGVGGGVFAGGGCVACNKVISRRATIFFDATVLGKAMRRAMDVVIVAGLIGTLAACGRVTVEPQRARILLNAESPRPTIDVADAPAALLQSIAAVPSEKWPDVLRVVASDNHASMPGQYALVDGRIRFTPLAPLHRGRPYHVTFAPPGWETVTATVSLPTVDLTPSTIVTQIFPTAEVLPANQRRFHIHFSAPMNPRGVMDFVGLFDDNGHRIDHLAPVTEQAWNEDRTICSIGLADEKDALEEGRTYTLAIDAAWRDGQGLPLKQPFRYTFTAGAPDDAEIDPHSWKTNVPAAGSRGPIVIIFPEPLDRESLLRSISVIGGDRKTVVGQSAVGAGEMTWSFAPDSAWPAGTYHVAVAGLEDLAGNPVARNAAPVLLPITIR